MVIEQIRAVAPGLTDERIQEFIGLAQLRRIARNDYAHKAGKPLPHLMFCLTGVLAVVHSNDTKEVVKQFVVDDEFVPSIVSLLEQIPTLVSIKALEDTTVLIWEGDTVRQLAAQDTAWLSFLNGIIRSNYCFKERRETMLLAYKPIHYYLYLIEHCPFIAANRISLHYIASYIGVAPETLSRIRGRKITSS